MLSAWRTTFASSLNGQPVDVAGLSPMTTLLDWLRDHRGLKGTKEGCAEGDCGACTVVLERADGRHEAMNACIALLGQMDGQSIRTVEGLLGRTARRIRCSGDGRIRRHAMRLLHAGLRDVGLCLRRGRRAGGARDHPRCAGRQSLPLHRLPADRRCDEEDPRSRDRARGAAGAAHGARRRSTARSSRRARSPSSWRCAPGIPTRCCWPAAPISACWPAARASRRPAVIHVTHVPELNVIEPDEEGSHHRRRRHLCARRCRLLVEAISGAAHLSRAARLAADPHHGHDRRQYRQRLADRRHAAGAAGAGDDGEAGLGARRARAAAGGVLYRLPQDRAGGRRGDPELPPAALWPGEASICDKVSKRRDQDISTVAAAYRLRIKDGRIEDVRLAFGGMAATPKRASHAEAALLKEAVSTAARAALRAGLPAARRLARHGRLSPAGRGQPVAPARAARSPSRSARSRWRRCEGRRPYRAASRLGAEARHRPGALYRRHAEPPAPCMPRWC